MSLVAVATSVDGSLSSCQVEELYEGTNVIKRTFPVLKNRILIDNINEKREEEQSTQLTFQKGYTLNLSLQPSYSDEKKVNNVGLE